MAGSSSVLHAGASILCLRLPLVETTGSPRFPGNPFANMPCSSTPADHMHQALCDARDVAFRAADDVGSAFSHVSRLNHTAYSLAVYASQLGLLRSNTTQDSLPAGGQPWRGRTLTCWVASGGFHSVLQLTSFPPPRSFAWRTSRRAAGGRHAVPARNSATALDRRKGTIAMTTHLRPTCFSWTIPLSAGHGARGCT